MFVRSSIRSLGFRAAIAACAALVSISTAYFADAATYVTDDGVVVGAGVIIQDEPVDNNLALELQFAALPGEKELELYVSPDGRPEGDGSRENPIDIQTAFTDADRVTPGMTVWLMGGTYLGPFYKPGEPSGTPERPIIYRAAPGERVTLTRLEGEDGQILGNAANHVWFWGFEVTSGPEVTRSGGIAIGGGANRGVKLINLIVHNNPHATGISGQTVGKEIYGCIVYRNGLSDDHFHHGLYTQCRLRDAEGVDIAEVDQRNYPTELLDRLDWAVYRDIVVFNNYGWGMHSYGGGQALGKMTYEGVVSFGNGVIEGSPRAMVNFISGGNHRDDLHFLREVHSYFPPEGRFRHNMDLGHRTHNHRVVVEDSRIIGGRDALQLRWWEDITLRNNIIFTDHGASVNIFPVEGQRFNFENNLFYRPNEGMTPILRGDQRVLDAESWREIVGENNNNRFVEGRPGEAWLHLRPNLYEPNRAHLIVYNWPETDAVEVDLAVLWPELEQGKTVRFADVEDVWGEPMFEGEYNGEPIEVPLGGEYAPHFACFLVTLK